MSIAASSGSVRTALYSLPHSRQGWGVVSLDVLHSLHRPAKSSAVLRTRALSWRERAVNAFLHLGLGWWHSRREWAQVRL